MNRKFRYLKEGLYVRIRSGTIQYHSKANKVFGLRNYSNIINLPYPCKLAQDMMFDEPSDKAYFEGQALTSKGTLHHPIIVTQIKDKQLIYKKKITPLAQLLEESKKPDADPEAVYRVRFFVASAPEDCTKFIKVYDAKKGEVKEASVKTSIKAKHESLVLNLPLLVKD